MPPHSYNVTINKEDFTETFTENSVAKVFLRLKQHIELTDTSPNAFRMKYITRNCKHKNFTLQITDRDHIPPIESKKAYSKRKYHKVQAELKELDALRQRVAELEEALRRVG